MALQTDKGYNWRQCSCCPYGYHIDLDFVRYCESIQHVERTGSFKRRKDRRRQRQSMEVLLGLINPITQEPLLPAISDAPRSPMQEALSGVVSDFEKTLQRSKNKLSHNLPDVTAVSGTEKLRRVPSVSSMSSTSSSSMTILHSSGDGPARDFDTISIESSGLSPAALHNIREQMALSLERTKELEEMVKMIPVLQGQIGVLEDENKHLSLRLQAEEESNLNRLNSNYFQYQYNNNRSGSSFNTDVDLNNALGQRVNDSRSKRDFGVMVSVLTRNVGVGHQTPHTKTVSTATANNSDNKYQHVDRWLTEKCKFLNGVDYVPSAPPSMETEMKKILSSKETQTALPFGTRAVALQTMCIQTNSREQAVQFSPKTRHMEIGVNILPKTRESFAQSVPETTSIGTSENTIDEILCESCKLINNASMGNVGNMGGNSAKNGQIEQQPISLANLSNAPRSRSFHLGEGKLDRPRRKTVGCQYDQSRVIANKSSQTETKTTSKYCQHDITSANKSIQSEFVGHTKGTNTVQLSLTTSFTTKSTDTKGLGPEMKHKACEITPIKTATNEVACNTLSDEFNHCCINCKNNEEAGRKEDAFTPSRIPRLQTYHSPTENRTFRRQDTYTKIPAADKSPTSSGLSALELLSSKTVAPEVHQFEKVKQKYKLSEGLAKINQNGAVKNLSEIPSCSDTQVTQEAVGNANNASNAEQSSSAQTPRKKCIPSKEMQAAMKVLNDSLQKNKSHSKQMTNANTIIENEWFRISSVVKADPLDVEDYLDSFEDISSVLLEYIVNMVDGSGNTAMHYAVSHGNFDVVSILLDSKVCDINKQNKAGYTSVMLVSLAEVASHTHVDVVRRLFSLADVNIRAKQHGQTALMLAVSHGRLVMVTLLLEAGADINIQDEDGSTALMCAAEHGHFEIVNYFLAQPDCDSTICDVDGSTALKIAMEAGHRHIGVQLYAHERNLHGNVAAVKGKKSKSASVSPKAPSSPLMQRSINRALPTSK